MHANRGGETMGVSSCSGHNSGARGSLMHLLRSRSGGLGLTLCLLGMIVALPTAAQAQVAIHGIGFSKGCGGPYNVGEAYTCTFSVQNTSVTDTALDTLTFT